MSEKNKKDGPSEKEIDQVRKNFVKNRRKSLRKEIDSMIEELKIVDDVINEEEPPFLKQATRMASLKHYKRGLENSINKKKDEIADISRGKAKDLAPPKPAEDSDSKPRKLRKRHKHEKK